MEQVEQIVAGERDYTKIKGGTGPLVYPAAHVYIYRALYEITDHGKNIFLAQSIFAVLYLATVALAMSCYKKAKVAELNMRRYIRNWLTALRGRLHYTSSLCLFSRNDYIVSSSYDFSMMDSPYTSSGSRYSSISDGYGHLGASRIAWGWESRCLYY